MQKITPCLWFDNNATEAVKFYTSVFKDSKVKHVAYYGDSASVAAKMPKDSVLVIDFELQGQDFQALNGGPVFKFTPAISMTVHCKDQDEVDYYWEKLSSEGGYEVECGWVTDKFGMSWQVVPTAMEEMMKDRHPEKVERAMKAMLKMKKLNIKELQKAFDGA